MEKIRNQLIIDVCNTIADPDSKLMRLNLVSQDAKVDFGA